MITRSTKLVILILILFVVFIFGVWMFYNTQASIPHIVSNTGYNLSVAPGVVKLGS